MIVWGSETNNLLLASIDCILDGREYSPLPPLHPARQGFPMPHKRPYDYDIDWDDKRKHRMPNPESRKCILTLGDGTEIDLSDDAPVERPDALMRKIDKVLEV